MKLKSLAIVLIALVVSSAGFAQGFFHAGLKGGVNMYKIDGSSFKQEFKYGYNAGVFAEINFSRKVGIQPEILWNQSQTRTTSKFNDMYDDGVSELKDVKLNYLSIPILLNYSPTRLITFQAGPQFGVLLNRNENLVDNGKQAFRSGDLSMLGGVQLNVGSVKLGGRYAVGLMNINDLDNRDKWKNEGFQLYLGLRIL